MPSKNLGSLALLILLALACNDKGIGDPVPVAEVRVTPSSRKIPVGGVLQLSVYVLDARGSTLTGRSVLWSSGAQAIATVSATGLVTGVSAGGPVTITATSEGQPGTAQVTVTGPAQVAAVSVSPGTPSILEGTVLQLVATTRDAQGRTVTGRAVIWSSGAEAIATVSATGLVTGVSAGGPVTITATSEGQLGTARVVVTAPPLPGYTLSLSAPALSVAHGQDPLPITWVNLVRSNFTGNVTLSVDNLPTGVAAFTPSGGTSGSSSYVVLAAAGNALPGTYSNLLVRAVASGLADRTAPLTLTITVAPFLLTLSSSTLSIVQGAATSTPTVNVVRNDFAGPVTLDLHRDASDDHGELPLGVKAAFAPNPATGTSAVLTLTVGAAVTPGVYYLFVSAGASTGGFCCIPLTLTVTAAASP